MEFQSLDIYCLNLIYEIEGSRNRASATGRLDAHQQELRKRRRLMQLISDFAASLSSFLGQAPRLWKLAEKS